ncbi:MAG TPA: alpha amylase C-terminal domain-containing protein, partial [Elusimicrobiota bacterium]|nr:alpha amylase C-terminal domain-containing protein [Elusimicrobiota bacterium]
FIRKFNETVYREHPDAVTIAEESTAWQNVSRPTFTGGLGFGYKWDMGWMHDTLAFLTLDAKERPAHQNELTFRALYAFSENYMMPLSHDEVGRGQGSLWRQAPGDERQKMAALRLLFGYQFAQPGKKLLFMGDEFGQRGAWNYEQALEWERLSEPAHQGLKRWVRDLNRTYRHHECLHARDCDPSGFEVIDFNNPGQCVVSFLRKGAGGEAPAVVVCNFLPEARPAYRVGAPLPGPWTAVLNSDADVYGGSCQGQPRVATENVSWNNRPQSVLLDLPPLSIQVLMPV